MEMSSLDMGQVSPREVQVESSEQFAPEVSAGIHVAGQTGDDADISRFDDFRQSNVRSQTRG